MISASSNNSGILLGAEGAVIITDTAQHNVPYFALKAVSDIDIQTMVCEDRIEGNLNGQTVQAGDLITLYRILSITLSSGVAIAYKA